MGAADASKVIDLSQLKVACSNCNLYQLCLPVGIDKRDLEELDKIIQRRRPVRRGEHLFRVGDPFDSIYAIRSGSIKSYTPTADGQERITGFHLPGELLGLGSIHAKQHACAGKALETASVCEIPFQQLEELAGRIPGLQHQLLNIMSAEILHDQSLLTLLGKKNAEERLASLLSSLSNRYEQRGFSPHEFHLSMSRSDIGNYLGLAVETVSRLFTRFQEEGLLTVQRKHIRILDRERLAGMAGDTRVGTSSQAHA